MPTLLDQYGRPVKTKPLMQRLAEPGITGVRQAFAGSKAGGLTPQRMAQLLRSADQGNFADFATLAEEMEERDPHYFAVLGSRKRAVSGVRPVIEAASEDARDEEIAEAVREHIAEHDGFPDLVEDLLDALGKGLSVVEIIWRREAKRWWPEHFEHVDPRFLVFDRETGREVRILDESDPLEGLPIPPYSSLIHRAKLKSGLAFRGGIARVVAFSWMCKAYTLKDWMAFVETYGLPLRLGRYGPEATKSDVEALYTAVANIGTDAAAVLPEGMKIDFESVTGNQGEAVFENLARYLDEQTSKAVLGQTMTSDDGSSQAQANVHNDVRYDIAASDARSVTATIRRDLVRPFVDLNWGQQDAYPDLRLEIAEPEDTDMLMRNVFRMASQGTSFKASEVRAKLGFSDPEDGDEIIGGAKPASAPEETAANRASEVREAEQDLAELEDEFDEVWQEVMEPLLDPLDALIRDAGSLEEVRDRLPEIFTDQRSGRMVEQLVTGMIRARATGDARD